MSVKGVFYETMVSSDQSGVAKKSASTSKVKVREARRSRTNFTLTQIDMMEKIFAHHSHYPDPDWIKEMSTALQLDSARITVWFKNRRAKEKRQRKTEEPTAPIETTWQSSYSSSFNPMFIEKVIQGQPTEDYPASVQPQSSRIPDHSTSQRKWEPVQHPMMHPSSLQLPSAPTRHMISEHQGTFNSIPQRHTTHPVDTQEQTTGLHQSFHLTNSTAPIGASHPSEHYQPSYLSGFSHNASSHHLYFPASREAYPQLAHIRSMFPYGAS